MKLKEVTIENFRSIKSLDIPLDDLTVLIGENNIGKSTVLEAIRIALTRGYGAKRGWQFSEYDFHLDCAEATPQSAEPISIILHFAEKNQDEWPSAIIQQMNECIQLDNDGLYHIWLRVKGEYQQTTSSFEGKWIFLNEVGNELTKPKQSDVNMLSRFVPMFFLSALRDATQEFSQRGQFWSGFLKSIQVPEDKRQEIERMLMEVNSYVIDANDGLSEVSSKIAEAGKHIPLGSIDPVVLEAVPTRIFDMVGKIQVHLKSNNGAKLPIQRYGEGTQSLAVLMLFQAFAAISLNEIYTPESTPILALEEPEAHLHPSAIRSLGSLLVTLAGQLLVTSHSGDLVSRVPVTSLRRLYKINGDTRVGRIETGNFTPREIQAINYNIRLTRGHYLFSRCWLFVEGESDFHFMPLIFELMGFSQDDISFSVIEISQVIKKGEPLIKFAQSLGIQWFLMADGDAEGQSYVDRASQYCTNGEQPSVRTKLLNSIDIEHEFWNNGFDDFIRSKLTETQINRIKLNHNDPDEEIKQLIKSAIKKVGGKPAFAQEIMQEVENKGVASIPQVLKDVVNNVVQMAGG
ncbi:MAG: DUF2813 domain-containing protein [Bacillota bacterium]|nr:DUF2813 domain-containing protein [Bacillota bacterium]MDW7676765.1 DUF2813 domain-containing protein [Bacillota bacterium]